MKYSAKSAAKEIAVLIPKLMTGIKAGMMVPQSVTPSQMTVMMALHEFKICTVGFLSRQLGVSDPTVTGIVDRLVRLGYVKRQRGIEDRRIVLVSLTRKGEEIIKKIQGIIRQHWARILSQLTDKERDTYIDIMHKIIKVTAEHRK